MENLTGAPNGWFVFLQHRHFRLKKSITAHWLALGARIRSDWRTGKYVPLAVILLIWTSLVVAAYYLNHPQPEPLADSWSYLYVVDQIQRHDQIVNFWRLPGYPLLIWLVYGLAGQGNLGAVSVVQGVLFVLSVLEFYILSGLLTRRAWLAFTLSLLIGSNVVILSYIKPIMSEGMALWLLTTLALAVTLFLHTFRLRFFWLVILCTFLLSFTRPEWIYLPPFLLAYLLLVACWRGLWRRFLAPTLLALCLLYSLVGGYALLNAVQNHFTGVTWIQGINLLGKVLQYRMANEASGQDAGIGHLLDTYLRQNINDPYIILSEQPVLACDYAARSGEFARGVILRHPLEFFAKSAPIFFSSLADFHLESLTLPNGPFSAPLLWLLNVFSTLYRCNLCFPLCALIWILLLTFQSMRQRKSVQQMGAVVLLALYGVSVTTLAAYRAIDYVRIYTVLEPLLVLTIGGTFFAPLLLASRGKLRWPAGAARQGAIVCETVRVDEREALASRGKPAAPRALVYRVGLLLVLGLLLFVWGASATPALRVFPNLVPLTCHRESDVNMLRGSGVGIMFITVKNRGQDTGPATMRVEFHTNLPVVRRVRLDEKLQALPAGAYRYFMVDLPRAPRSGNFLDPVGPVTISLSAGRVNPPDSVLVTGC